MLTADRMEGALERLKSRQSAAFEARTPSGTPSGFHANEFACNFGHRPAKTV